MHLFFLSRGNKLDRDNFVNSLSNMWLPMNVKDKKGNVSIDAVQGLLQPIELWSFNFPEENLEKVLRTLKPDNSIGVNSLECPSPKLSWTLAGIRKMLKLDKIPKWNPKGNSFPLIKNNIKISGIGIKRDYKDKYGNECL